MQLSNLGYHQAWAIVIYLVTTGIKAVSSMELHRNLEITQKSAWYLAHRVRKAFDSDTSLFSGQVEVDDAYFGDKEKNKHNSKELKAGRGAVGKTAVVGLGGRETSHVSALVVGSTDKGTPQGFITDCTTENSTVYIAENLSYQEIPGQHQTVKHSMCEYVNGMTHTSSIESFWALLRRGYRSIYHHMSEKHLGEYVNEFAGRHNIKEQDTIDQMKGAVKGMVGKRLKYKDLIA